MVVDCGSNVNADGNVAYELGPWCRDCGGVGQRDHHVDIAYSCRFDCRDGFSAGCLKAPTLVSCVQIPCADFHFFCAPIDRKEIAD
uniref:Uncharacterized protein n=1 Tax=Panagrellus redivivus TaxID=6233 RepID=A0A7E4V104_PANRE